MSREFDRFFERLEAAMLDGDRPVGELRIPCSPDDPADDGHKHLCSCGTCWKHSDAIGGLFSGVSQAEFNEAHSCPSCGTRVTWKHGY